jgi:uncharacterized protein YndB with AHSA1/START domain
VQTGSPELTLEIERLLPARASQVFASLIEEEELSRWWGPRGFAIPSVDFPARVGERFRIEMQPPEGDSFYLSGEFREVDPPSRLVYTFRWEDPDPDDVENLVGLSLRKRGQSTQLAMSQGPFGTEARLALHRDGWGDSLDKLERLLEARS